MDEQRWQRVKDYFEQARLMTPPERTPWLEKLATMDPESAEEVQTLLLACADLPDVYEEGAEQVLAAFQKVEPDLFRAGDVVGPYTLEERVGTGGMGSVWRSRREDDLDTKRRYAIKFVRRGLDTANVLKRFAAEYSTLRTLDHPNIARLVDGGLTTDDQPYLVMDFVDGERIDVWCDSRRIRIEERLVLFREVCEAVHFAHKGLVVHRDLKPENILVTGDGVPVLLDFGIAKMLDPNLGAATATRVSGGPLTPQYASPEQLVGGNVSTASDLYSLGVILYEMISGTPPYRLQSIARDALWSELQSTHVPRPSQAVTDKTAALRGQRVDGLRRTLRGDLDTMAAMAMRFDPARRYDSAGQMAEDVGHYLTGQPVIARPDTWSYRLGKSANRNKGVVAALVALIAVTVYSFFEIAAQEKIALEEAQFAQGEAESLHRVVDVMIGLFESETQHPDRNILLADEIVRRGWTLLQEDSIEDPLVRSTLQLALGRVFTSLGDFDKAASALESGVESRRELYDAPHAEIAEALAALGGLRLEEGRLEEAEALLLEAMGMWEATWGVDSLDAATTEHLLGKVFMRLGKYEAARSYLAMALQARTHILGKDHGGAMAVRRDLRRIGALETEGQAPVEY